MIEDPSNGTHVLIVVPQYAIGKVIGRRGATIAELGKVHCCSVEFRRDETFPNGDTPLEVTSKKGNSSDVETVVEKVLRIVSTII